MTGLAYTPPLGFAVLTPLYDRLIACFTREGVWRGRLVGHISAKPGETILDVGSGAGSLAIAVTAAEPSCCYHGVDPDSLAVELARGKAVRAGSLATFEAGRFGKFPASDGQRVDKIVCTIRCRSRRSGGCCERCWSG